MTQKTVIWLTIAVYVVFISAVGLLNAKKSKNITEFTVGKRNAGAWLSAFSYGTAYFSAVMFIGYAGGTGWKYGLWGILPGIGNAIIGSLLAWVVLAKKTRELTRQHKIKSMPQLFEKRFHSTGMKNFCTAVIFLFLIPYSASVYKGLTSVCSVLLGVDERVCMIVIALASLLIVVLGGYGATLKADPLSLEVNNPITFTLIADDGTDITAQATIFDRSHDFVEVPNPFTPTADGKYEFYAVAGNIITETVVVTVLPSIPELPADSDEANTSFKHRILLIDHTGNTCGYCPQMMLALKEVSESGDYHSKYYEAMAHSYASTDPATSAAANAISSYYGVNSYPTLTYNFLHPTTSSFNAEHIKQQIDAQWKEAADAGIAASASLAAKSVVVNTEVKAAVENEYRITAWLLEDGIEANQINATESWMNIHNNAIRQASTTSPISAQGEGSKYGSNKIRRHIQIGKQLYFIERHSVNINFQKQHTKTLPRSYPEAALLHT